MDKESRNVKKSSDKQVEGYLCRAGNKQIIDLLFI